MFCFCGRLALISFLFLYLAIVAVSVEALLFYMWMKRSSSWWFWILPLTSKGIKCSACPVYLQWMQADVKMEVCSSLYSAHPYFLKSYDSFVWWIGCNLNLCLKYFSNIICADIYSNKLHCGGFMSYWFKTTWGWVNNDRMFCFEWMCSIRWWKFFQPVLLIHIAKPVCTRSVYNLHPFTGLFMPAGDCIDLVCSAHSGQRHSRHWAAQPSTSSLHTADRSFHACPIRLCPNSGAFWLAMAAVANRAACPAGTVTWCGSCFQ